MKPLKKSLLSCFALLAAVLALALPASAQLVAYDDAGNYIPSWLNGTNLGFGFTPWMIVTNGPNSHGYYIKAAVVTPAFANASITNVAGTVYTNVWGIFANGATGINETAAYRGFVNPLGTNTFKLQWGSKGAGSTTVSGVGTVHGQSGFSLRNGNTTNSSSDWQTGTRLYVYFLDGAAPSTIYVLDGSGGPISLTGTSFSNLGRTSITNALEVEVTVGADGDHYHLVMKDCVQNKTLYTLDSILGGSPGSTVDSVALFNRECTGDQVYNRMQIAVPTLVPPTVVNVQPTNGSIFLPTATPISFEVDSFNSLVSSNFTGVFLNGVQLSGSTYNTAGTTSQLLGTNNAVLAANTFYTVAVVSQDANGNVVSNAWNFNTFSPNNTCIQAEDYNYGAGQYFASPSPLAYANLLGTNGIDYLDLTTLTNLNNYRPDYNPGDPVLPQLIPATDTVDHDQYFEGSIQDYQMAYTDTGDWENYTRSFPGTRFTIYARAASAGSGVFQVSLLANPTATSSNQPLAALGTCAVPNTGGTTVYAGQLTPLTDLFGNTVVLNLSGVNTLQQTSISSRGYNLYYLMMVPNSSTSLLKPYISTGSPAPGVGGVALDSPISFTIANRATAVNSSTIKLFVNTNNVTASLVLSSNAAGTTVTYTPSVYLAPNSTNTLTVIFNDNTGTNSTTNSWSFATLSQTLSTLTNGLLASPSSTRGFGLSLYKIDNTGPEPGTAALALQQLSGQVTNGATLLPWTNTINGTFVAANYLETNALNYDTTGNPTGVYSFTNKAPFPLIPTNGAQLNFVMQALFYLQLNAGSYHLAVRSDDGFGLNTGPTPATASLSIGQFNSGRANTTPTDIFITAPTNGYYPMNLLYFQESGGGSIEFYSISNGVSTLINDPANPNALKAFAVLPPALQVLIINTAHTGNATTFNFQTQSGYSHYVEYKNALTDPSWTPLTTIPGDGTMANVTDSTASGVTRFYRVRTQ